MPRTLMPLLPAELAVDRLVNGYRIHEIHQNGVIVSLLFDDTAAHTATLWHRTDIPETWWEVAISNGATDGNLYGSRPNAVEAATTSRPPRSARLAPCLITQLTVAGLITCSCDRFGGYYDDPHVAIDAYLRHLRPAPPEPARSNPCPPPM